MQAVSIAVLFLLTAFFRPVSAEPGPFLQPGTIAPTTSIEDLTGTRHPVPATDSWSLVFFWSLFCHTCLDEIPHLITETAHLASPSCRPFFISLDGTRMKKGLQNFLDKRRLTATILVDEIASAAYLTADQWGVRTTPSVFLVDPGGVIRYSRSGPFDIQEIFAIMQRTERGASPTTTSLVVTAPIHVAAPLSTGSTTEINLPSVASTTCNSPIE